jgi:uncharacterized protein with ParB-like and HNH nuclease domain
MSGYNFEFLSDIFKDGLYSIPDYQRNYSWEEQQLKDLWEDLEGIDLTIKSNHYTGTTVVEKLRDIAKLGKTYRAFKIVDGQQRLATLSILVFCICERLKAFATPDSEKTATNLYNEYIKDESVGFYKLGLNKDDDTFFKDVILQEHPKEIVGKQPATHSEKRLVTAKEYFKEKLKDKDLQYINDLVEKITSRLIFIKYEVGSEVEAGLIFEVMNDRGKPLTQVDKIKNYLIYVAYKKEDSILAGEINETMGEIFRNLMEVERFDEDDLLRYHWIMYKGEYETELISDVHRLLKEHYKMKDVDVLSGIKDYIQSLKEASYVFKELNNPYKSFAEWGVSAEDIRRYLKGLDRLRNTATFMPLLMAARIIYRDSPKRFEEIVRCCETFAFRVYKVANRRTDTRYSSFCKLSNELFKARQSDTPKKDKIYRKILKQINESLEDYCDDDEFKSHLSRTGFYYGWMDNYEVKYLLNELENRKCLDNKESPPNWEEIDKKATIEHIWPDSPRMWSSWTKEEKETHQKHVYNLGNLTLTFWNPSLSNKDFPDKKEMYKQSNLAIQRELASNNSWGATEVEKRTKEIIEFALKRWKL